MNLRLGRLFKPKKPGPVSRPADPATEAADDLPSIPDNANEDVPRYGAGAVVPTGPDPEGDHRRKIDGKKVKFAFRLITGSLAAAIGLTLIQAIWFQNVPNQFNGMIDLLKLVGTTALGFVFGRSLGQGEK